MSSHDRDLFWDIEIDGHAYNGTTWLVPTADDDLTGKDPKYCFQYSLPSKYDARSAGDLKLNDIDITIVPIRDNGVLDIIGGELWEACFYLCAYILQRADFFVKSSVLELGAGLGLPGLLLAQLKSLSSSDPSCRSIASSQMDVCMTDNSLELLEHLSRTVVRMGASPMATACAAAEVHFSDLLTDHCVTVGVKHLDWQAYVDISDCDWTLKPRRPEDLMDSSGWDAIIGSALVYSPAHASVAFVLR